MSAIKQALILYGPSGVGKSTLAGKLCRSLGFKHCDCDSFKLIFSAERSPERTEIAGKISYLYAKELIDRGHDVLIEALPIEHNDKLIKRMKERNYHIVEISLQASLEQCIRNNRHRTTRGFSDKVIKEVYPTLLFERGTVIDVTGKTPATVYAKVRRLIV
jgi:predicted kinase